MPILCHFFFLSLLPLLTLRSPDALFSYGVSVSSFRHSNLGLTLRPDLEDEDDILPSHSSSSVNQNDNKFEEPFLLDSLYQSVNLNPDEQRFSLSDRMKQEEPSIKLPFDRDNDFQSRKSLNEEEISPTDTELEIDHQILKALEDILGTLKNQDRVSPSKASSNRREEEENDDNKKIINSPSSLRESEVNFWDEIQQNHRDVGNKNQRTSSISSSKELGKQDKDALGQNQPNREEEQSNQHEIDDYSTFLSSLMTGHNNQRTENEGEEERPLLLENLYKSGKLDPDEPDLLMNYLLSADDNNVIPSTRMTSRGFDVDRSRNDVSNIGDKQIEDDLQFLFSGGPDDSVMDTRLPLNSPRKRQNFMKKTSHVKQNPLDQLLQQMLSDDIKQDDQEALTFGNKVSSSSFPSHSERTQDQIRRVSPYFVWADDLEREEPVLPEAWKSNLDLNRMILESAPQRKLPISEADGVTRSTSSSSSSNDESLSKRTDVRKPGPRFPPVSTKLFFKLHFFSYRAQKRDYSVRLQSLVCE
jgi:hypothetical protein